MPGQVTINSCNGGAGQKWTVGTGSTVTNAASAGCVDTGGTADNAPVVSTCDGGSGQASIKRS